MQRILSADGCVRTPYEPRNLDLYRAMPGAWWDSPNKCWRVSLADGDRARLLELADRLKLQVAPELRKIVASRQANNAHAAGLYPFQVVGVDWLSKRDKALLGDDMGLGKTIETLVAAPANAAVLVTCPANVKYTWAAECKKWRPDLKPVVLTLREKTVDEVYARLLKAANKKDKSIDEGPIDEAGLMQKAKAEVEATKEKSFRFAKPGEVVIANYDILPEWLEPKKVNENGPAWDIEVKLPLSVRQQARNNLLVADEAHRLKNHKTARAKRVRGLALVCGKVWGLTGTPLENRPPDLWGTLSCLGLAHIVFGKWEKFVQRMNGVKNQWGGYEWGTPDPIVPELMRRVMLRRRRPDVLPDLPRKTYKTIVCDLDNHLRTTMDNLWEQWAELIENKELPPFEEFSTIREQLAVSRIPIMLEMVEDCEEAEVPTIVASAHLAPIEALANRPGWAVITGATPAAKRQQVVNDFQAGKLKGIGLTIRAGGEGITLTRAWKVIEVDLDWVPSKNEQLEDRACRIGQTSNKVEVDRLVSDHPLDLHVLKLIAWKMGITDAALEVPDWILNKPPLA